MKKKDIILQIKSLSLENSIVKSADDNGPGPPPQKKQPVQPSGQPPAVPGAPPPRRPAGSPAGGTTGSARPTGPARPIAAPLLAAKKAISEMQRAIQVFASTVVNYHTQRSARTSRLTPIFLTPQSGPSQQPPQNFKDFNDFITLNYLNSSPIRGNEWRTDATADIAEEKDPVYDDQLIEMEKVVDNLGKIGHSPTERDRDGQWEYRTQNALKDCYAFGDAMMRLSGDFDVSDEIRRSFTANDLLLMRQQIPTTNGELAALAAPKKMEKAKNLTKLLDKLTRFYLAVSNAVTKHPAYRRFTQQEQRVPLWRQQPSSADVRDPGDTSQYADLDKQKDSLYLYNMRIFDRTGTPRRLPQFPLIALEKPYMLVDILTQYGWLANEIDNKVKTDFIRDILKQIDDRIDYLKNPVGKQNPEMPLVQGPGSPFAPGGPLAPMPPGGPAALSGTISAPGGGSQPWEWASPPDTRNWIQRNIFDHGAPPGSPNSRTK